MESSESSWEGEEGGGARGKGAAFGSRVSLSRACSVLGARLQGCSVIQSLTEAILFIWETI